jgi:hypothetical protein
LSCILDSASFQRRRNTALVNDIAAIVEQVYGDLARHPHDPIKVVRVSLRPVPNGIPHREDGP